jgi:hypothetical protein
VHLWNTATRLECSIWWLDTTNMYILSIAVRMEIRLSDIYQHSFYPSLYGLLYKKVYISFFFEGAFNYYKLGGVYVYWYNQGYQSKVVAVLLISNGENIWSCGTMHDSCNYMFCKCREGYGWHWYGYFLRSSVSP